MSQLVENSNMRRTVLAAAALASVAALVLSGCSSEPEGPPKETATSIAESSNEPSGDESEETTGEATDDESGESSSGTGNVDIADDENAPPLPETVKTKPAKLLTLTSKDDGRPRCLLVGGTVSFDELSGKAKLRLDTPVKHDITKETGRIVVVFEEEGQVFPVIDDPKAGGIKGYMITVVTPESAELCP